MGGVFYASVIITRFLYTFGHGVGHLIYFFYGAFRLVRGVVALPYKWYVGYLFSVGRPLLGFLPFRCLFPIQGSFFLHLPWTLRTRFFPWRDRRPLQWRLLSIPAGYQGRRLAATLGPHRRSWPLPVSADLDFYLHYPRCRCSLRIFLLPIIPRGRTIL